MCFDSFSTYKDHIIFLCCPVVVDIYVKYNTVLLLN